jgi:DNA-binding NarL/FixJ family response regulator
VGAILKVVSSLVRVLVVDDHPVVRDGVEMLAQSCARIALVGYAPSGKEALRIAQEADPDVVLLDLRLPDTLAPELIRGLRAIIPRAAIVLFTAFPDHPAVAAALDAGAAGVFPKDASRIDLVSAITRAADLGNDGAPHDGPLRRESPSPIARREYDVLRRVATGETNQEIAEAMNLSPNTVKAYLRNAMQKLDARNRVEAISRAREAGLL